MQAGIVALRMQMSNPSFSLQFIKLLAEIVSVSSYLRRRCDACCFCRLGGLLSCSSGDSFSFRLVQRLDSPGGRVSGCIASPFDIASTRTKVLPVRSEGGLSLESTGGLQAADAAR